MDSTLVLSHSHTLFQFSNFVPAIAAVLGVLVGAFVSIYGARLQFRAQVRAKSRQDWITLFRESIAEYQLKVLLSGPVSTNINFVDHITDADARANKERALFLLNRIRLMLNRDDEKHVELVNKMVALNGEIGKGGSVDENHLHVLYAMVMDSSLDILAKETNKANKGK